jgi:chaperonin GroEL
MARLLGATLGPSGRSVLIAPSLRGEATEVLDSAGTVARRAITLGGRVDTVGAMLVRSAACQVKDSQGDGAATTAILLWGILGRASRLVAAGYAATDLAAMIDAQRAVADGLLRAQAAPVEAAEELMGVVATMLPEAGLAELVAEAAESVGLSASVQIRDGMRRETECEYVEGVRWEEGILSRHLGLGDGGSVEITEPDILVTDHVIDQAGQLLPVLEASAASGRRRLFLIAADVRGAALALLGRNLAAGALEAAVAVRAPFGSQREEVLEDLAAITGARSIRIAAGDRLESVRPSDFGGARRAWATVSDFGLVGGRGQLDEVRERLQLAGAELARPDLDEQSRTQIEARMGQLNGVAAIIHVGGVTDLERAERRVRIEAAVRAARAAQRGGAVPGCGAALAACAAGLRAGAGDAGTRVLAAALEEPIRQIARNAGLDGGEVLQRTRERSPGWRYDVVRRDWVSPDDRSRLLDPLPVVRASLDAAVSMARIVLTSGALVCKRAPELSIRP